MINYAKEKPLCPPLEALNANFMFIFNGIVDVDFVSIRFLVVVISLIVVLELNDSFTVLLVVGVEVDDVCVEELLVVVATLIEVDVVLVANPKLEVL